MLRDPRAYLNDILEAAAAIAAATAGLDPVDFSETIPRATPCARA